MSDPASTAGLLAAGDAAHFVRSGHFAYESGDHGDTWLALELLFCEPRRLQRAAARLARGLARNGADVVCGPLVGGALVGQWVAAELGTGFVYAEPQAERSPAGPRYAVPRELRSSLSGKRVLIADDVINAGSATGACVREVESLGGRVVALGCLIVRESALPDLRARFGAPIVSLLAVPWNVWPAPACPLCRSGVELSPTS